MSKNISVQYVRQPAFYDDFHCIGSECPVNCCFGWGIIGWTKKEYEKLENANMSQVLREKFKKSFKSNTNKQYLRTFDYMIEYDKSGKCPMLTENNLCMIQKELGEEYLSHTCRVYPRKGQKCGDILIRTCQPSCMHVLKLVCSDENSMELINMKHGKDKGAIDGAWTLADLLSHPSLKYERKLFELFYEILSDKTHSIETSFVLAGMSAVKIDEFIHRGQADKIPEIIKALKPQLCSATQIEKLENAKPNLSLKGNFAAGLLKIIRDSDIYKNVFENGTPSEEKWNEGMEKWNAVFGDRPYVWRNIALNLFISQRMPFRDKEYSLFENICYLAAEMSVAKFLAAAIPVQFGKNTEQSFYISTAYIDRSFTHDSVNVKKIIDYIKAFGITSPAYLMGILR